MNFENLPGSFGENTTKQSTKKKDIRKTNAVKDKISSLSAENIIDIVCCSAIAVIMIIIFCNWETVMSTLFMSFLFPIIKALSKIIAVAAGALCIGGVLWARINRHRRWYW